jgi:hypothetical protein
MNRSDLFLKTGSVIAVVGTLGAALLGLSFLRVSPGASIRPMGAAIVLAQITVLTFIGGLAGVVIGWKGHPRWLRWLAAPLAFAPFPMFHLTLTLAQNARGFTLAP